MLNSRKGRLITSLLAAVLLWVYVIGKMDPVKTKKFEDIPVKYINEQTLIDNGLAVHSAKKHKISVSISGHRSDVVRVKKMDIQATVDLAQAGKGDNMLSINVSVPGKVEVDKQSLHKVKVNISRLVSINKEVKAAYMGDYVKGEEPTTLSIDPKNVLVTGAEENVNSVTHVRAEVDKGSIGKHEKIVRARLTPMNKKGREVGNVTLSQSTANIKTVLYNTKTVDLKIPVVDESRDGLKRKVDKPDSITIKGPKHILERIKSIKTEPLYITEIEETGRLSVIPILPDNVTISGQEKGIYANVFVGKGEDSSREFAYSSDAVDIKGLEKGFHADIDMSGISVTVTGTKKEISKVTDDDIKISINLEGYKEGVYKVPLDVVCSEKHKNISLSENKINVSIVREKEE